MGRVQAFKLIDGDEIVAEVIDQPNNMLTEAAPGPSDVWVLRRPHSLKMQPMGGGQVGLAFIPWTLSNPGIERVELPAGSVIARFHASDQVEKQYIQQTSGISLAV